MPAFPSRIRDLRISWNSTFTCSHTHHPHNCGLPETIRSHVATRSICTIVDFLKHYIHMEPQAPSSKSQISWNSTFTCNHRHHPHNLPSHFPPFVQGTCKSMPLWQLLFFTVSFCYALEIKVIPHSNHLKQFSKNIKRLWVKARWSKPPGVPPK